MASPIAAVADNHCPYGCTHADLDEHGYCHHLIGWTSDGKTYEKLVRGRRGLRQIQCNEFDPVSGTYQRVVHKIPRDAVLVNPIQRQLVNTIWHEAKKWVSDRVYRKNVVAEKVREEVLPTEEVVQEEEEALA